MTNLLSLIDSIHYHFNKIAKLDQEKELLYRHLKLSEEFGELSNDVLAYLWHQRPEKLATFDKDNLWWEIIDVVIAALLIGKTADIDLEQAIADKIAQLSIRFNHNQQ